MYVCTTRTSQLPFCSKNGEINFFWSVVTFLKQCCCILDVRLNYTKFIIGSWPCIDTISVILSADGALVCGQVFLADEVSPGTRQHVTPLLGYTRQNWFMSNQRTNTACSQRTPTVNINSHFPCPNCHKEYTWKANLNRHLRLECGKKPHLKCPYCTYVTNRKSSVQEHIRRRHKDLPNIM
jgi:predicted RNA-binding Zn-ribbon protein involved in translation (DUF1610 family)